MSVSAPSAATPREQMLHNASKELYDKLLAEVRRLLESGDIADFLRFQANFHRYSFANNVLIRAHCPHATWVAGIRTWNHLGRRVKRGERGIPIFAPRFAKITLQRVDPVTGNVTEEEEERLVGFKVVYVWDVSQTEGAPLPQIRQREIPRFAGADQLVVRIAAASPVPVQFVDAAAIAPALGVYRPAEGKVYVGKDLRPEEKAAVLLHELAHALADVHGLDWPDLPSQQQRIRAEALAEGAAYIAGSHLGLDVTAWSSAYVALWAKSCDNILAWGEEIRRLAVELISLVTPQRERAEGATVA